MFLLFGITFIAAGLDYIIASIYKMPHIYCVSQSMKNQFVTYYPYEMDWKNNFDKKYFYGDTSTAQNKIRGIENYENEIREIRERYEKEKDRV